MHISATVVLPEAVEVHITKLVSVGMCGRMALCGGLKFSYGKVAYSQVVVGIVSLLSLIIITLLIFFFLVHVNYTKFSTTATTRIADCNYFRATFGRLKAPVASVKTGARLAITKLAFRSALASLLH